MRSYKIGLAEWPMTFDKTTAGDNEDQRLFRQIRRPGGGPPFRRRTEKDGLENPLSPAIDRQHIPHKKTTLA
jgi:hypothetical protein